MQISDSDIYDKERKHCSTKSSHNDTIFASLLNSLKQIAGLFGQRPGFYFAPYFCQEFTPDLAATDASIFFWPTHHLHILCEIIVT